MNKICQERWARITGKQRNRDVWAASDGDCVRTDSDPSGQLL